ncbi:UNVERIFIED_CONTAM: hypothetical protein Sangu_2171500 [Sesamum angustifolium]|uniref:Reverse transcriptase domain-containing protein n=1 Tax=Sesamum angustifolium TaxID=2727405 RepID=A0AAW2LG66_9LAMI
MQAILTRKWVLLGPVVKSRNLEHVYPIACAALGWQARFPNARVSTAAARGSYHTPLIINLDAKPNQWSGKRKRLMRNRVRNELEEFLSREELRWKQRSKAQWLRERDRNTLFFFMQERVPGDIRILYRGFVIEVVSGALQRKGFSKLSPHSLKDLFWSVHPTTDGIVEVLWGLLARVTDDMNEAESRGKLRGVAISRQGPRVSHLLFADDTLIFCQASEEAMYCVRWVLKEFEAASEMVVNLEK